MQTRILGAAIGLTLTAALAGCGGGDKTSDVNSATAQQCKAELSKIIDRALAAGAAGQDPKISDDDKPAVCDKVADDAGRTITEEITREASDKARKQIESSLGTGGTGASTSAGGSASAGAATAGLPGSAGAGAGAGASTGSAGTASAGLSAGPAALPVGNAEWRLEKSDLKRSAGGFFGGTVSVRYLGTEKSILSETTPGDVLVYQGGKKVATLLFAVGAPGSGELKVAMVISEDAFVNGPYTFTLLFE